MKKRRRSQAERAAAEAAKPPRGGGPGLFLARESRRGGGVSVIDVPTGEVTKLDETATSIAVGDSDTWFATVDGRILR